MTFDATAGCLRQGVKVYNHKTRQHIAVKMVRKEKRFRRQAREEIWILERSRKQDKDTVMNVIHFYEHFSFRNHICVTFELLGMNLYELIKESKFQGFSLHLVRKFARFIPIAWVPSTRTGLFTVTWSLRISSYPYQSPSIVHIDMLWGTWIRTVLGLHHIRCCWHRQWHVVVS